jgi:hypothetical protein
MALANAFGVIGALYFLGCYLVASFAPEIYKAVAATWFHMLDLSSAWKSAPEGFVLGLVSFTAVSWISGWVFAWTYNKLIK